jgi:phage shock protein PspC (stress-responsive transcriptional regulator)
VVADRELEPARVIAGEVGGLAVQFDAARESGVRALIAAATASNGPIR